MAVESQLKVLVQRVDTEAFLKLPHSWVDDLKEATPFRNYLEALQAAKLVHDYKVQIRMQFLTDGTAIVLPCE